MRAAHTARLVVGLRLVVGFVYPPCASPAQAPPTVQPAPRHHHAITYDPATRRVFVIGGARYDGTTQVVLDELRSRSKLGDTCEWDGLPWRQVAP